MTDHLTAARHRYLDFYRAGLRKKADEACGVAPELLLLFDADNSAVPELHRLYRMDAVLKTADEKHKLTEFNPDPLPPAAGPVATEAVGAMAVGLFPLVWSAIEVRYPGGELAGFDGWYAKWLNVTDDRPRDADGLAGVVHKATRHTDPDGWRAIAIDGGSAPVEAVTELLDLLAASGVPEAAVGSFSYTRGNP